MIQPIVSIVMDDIRHADLSRAAASLLNTLSIPFEMNVLSAYRTPGEAEIFSRDASRRGIKVIIAFAHKSAALPGIISSMTTLPVIGVPVDTCLGGNDALLSMVQMPDGVPVATVGINASTNAALLAVRILALNDAALMRRLNEYNATMNDSVIHSSELFTNMNYEYKTN